VVPTKYYYGNKTEEGDIGGKYECIQHGRDQKCIHNSGSEIRKEDAKE
jgi:hypothetical protein